MKFLKGRKVVYTKNDNKTIIIPTLRDSDIQRSETFQKRISYLGINKMNISIVIGFEDGECRVLDGENLKLLFSTEIYKVQMMTPFSPAQTPRNSEKNEVKNNKNVNLNNSLSSTEDKINTSKVLKNFAMNQDISGPIAIKEISDSSMYSENEEEAHHNEV